MFSAIASGIGPLAIYISKLFGSKWQIPTVSKAIVLFALHRIDDGSGCSCLD